MLLVTAQSHEKMANIAAVHSENARSKLLVCNNIWHIMLDKKYFKVLTVAEKEKQMQNSNSVKWNIK